LTGERQTEYTALADHRGEHSGVIRHGRVVKNGIRYRSSDDYDATVNSISNNNDDDNNNNNNVYVCIYAVKNTNKPTSSYRKRNKLLSQQYDIMFSVMRGQRHREALFFFREREEGEQKFLS